MDSKNLDWPVLSMSKGLEEFGGNPCAFIDLRRYRFRSEKEVSISGFSGLLKTHIKKDDNGAAYGGIMITSNDSQITIAFNDFKMIDDLIDKLTEVKRHSFKSGFTYQLKENVRKDNQI